MGYTIGLVPNPRLEAIAEPLLERAERESDEQGGEKVRLVADARKGLLPGEQRRRRLALPVQPRQPLGKRLPLRAAPKRLLPINSVVAAEAAVALGAGVVLAGQLCLPELTWLCSRWTARNTSKP